MAIRQPIVATLGHVDHGKTTLLDSIRGTAVAAGEAGGITQAVGASHIPIETIKKISGKLLEKFKVKVTIPGLLFVDTPGHEAFASLRKRGGSVADLAILVIDVNEGFQQQTDESLNLLKQFKVPFVVVANKIDRIAGWYPNHNEIFSDSISKQRDDVRDELENKLYKLVAQLADRGFESERFDRITDFTKQIAIVPCSGRTKEGIAELLMMLMGLAQQFLEDKLQLSDIAKGSVLEVKDMRGLGTTIDVILYDGKLKTGDYIIIGGRTPLVAKIRSLLIPRPLQELRVERQFGYVDEVIAATGVKISAVGLDEAISGSPIVAVDDESKIEEAKKLVEKEVEEIIYEKQPDGITVKADTLGSLEAMVKMLKEGNIPIRQAEIGNLTRQDVLEVQNVTDDLRKIILVFNQKIPEDVKLVAKDLNVRIFDGNVIYRILEEYKEWCTHESERRLQEKMASVGRPAEVRILKGSVFRASNPAIFGVEVLKGTLKANSQMKRVDGKIIGKIKELQKEGKQIDEAKKGDKAAISIDGPTIGRQIFEGDKLIVVLSDNDRKVLKEVYDKLSGDEKELLESSL